MLRIGDGQVGATNDGEVSFKLPEDILIRDAPDPIVAMVSSTYPSLMDHVGDGLYFQDRANLAPTNEIVHEINDYIMSLLPGDSVEFMISDNICLDEDDIINREDVYLVEFLNTIKASGIPNHLIRLKVWLSNNAFEEHRPVCRTL